MAAMTDSPDRKKFDWSFRWRLAGAVLCWGAIAIASFQISDVVLWYPDFTAWLALAAALCTLAVLVRPDIELTYRYGGALGVGTLVLRCASLTEAQVRSDTTDYLWLAVAQVAITALFAFLYANWWLVDVKDWHRVHRLVGR
jgi:hypothetical protein